MDPIDENPEQVAKRFAWVSDDSILVCSRWGFEKLLQINKKTINGQVEYSFHEISSGSVPGFSELDYKTHLYVEQPSLGLGDVYNRLRRKQ